MRSGGHDDGDVQDLEQMVDLPRDSWHSLGAADELQPEHRHRHSSAAVDETEDQHLLPQDIELVAQHGGGNGSLGSSNPSTSFQAEKHPERHNSLLQTAMLLVADIVGTGVLGLPGHMAKLGWALGIAALLGCMIVNLYTGLIIGRLGSCVPGAVSYGDMALQVCSPRLSAAAYCCVYSSVIASMGGYMLVLGRTVQAMFYSAPICLPVASFLAAVFVWPVAQLRTFHQLSSFILVGNATIVAVIAICIVDMIAAGRTDPDNEPTVKHVALEDIGYSESVRGLSALTGIVFAYSGQGIFLEIISEMRSPSHFHRPLKAAAGFLFGLYTTISGLGYGFKGRQTPALLLDVLPYTWLRSVTNLTLFVHMIISYQIKLQDVCRAAHLRMSPSTTNSKCMKGRLWWTFFTTSMLFMSWMLANAVPFFDDAVGILGAVMSAPASFGFPAIFALSAARRPPLPGCSAFKLQRFEGALLVLLVIFTVFLMTAGLGSNIVSMRHHNIKHGGPFSCHCNAAPSVCATARGLNGTVEQEAITSQPEGR